MTADARYQEPDWFTRNIFNRIVRRMARMGLSVAGSAELRVRGRASGEWRTTPVNPLPLDGHEYLIAPRGTTQWVRNIRAAGGGELKVGRKVRSFTVEEVPDERKIPILREYIRRWKWEVGQFFPGLDGNSPDEQLAQAAPGFPIFLIHASA